MTRGKVLIGAFVMAFVASALPAVAQNGKAGGADREGGAVDRATGSAVDRSSAGGSDSPSSSSSSSPSSGSGGSDNSAWTPSSRGSDNSNPQYYSAPSRPSERYEREQGRQRGDGDSPRSNGGSRAVPRGSDSISGGSTAGTAASPGREDADHSARAVPRYSRPRDGRPATGSAVDREGLPPNRSGGYYPYSLYPDYYSYWGGYGSPYYGRRYYYLPGYGFGLGYLYDPLAYGGDSGYGGYGGYGGGYYGGSGRAGYGQGPTGSLRLKIKPRNAQVYVDGYFVGEVDQFDGIFQRLDIDAGAHRIEIRADGHETITFEVLIQPRETVTYKGELKTR